MTQRNWNLFWSYKLHNMEQKELTVDDVFRKYVFDHTNNEPLTDMICRLNTSTKNRTVVPGEPELNDDEIFATNLYELVPSADLVTELCHIRDMLYGDGSRVLDIDPTYNDATVETEARPKCATLAWFQAVNPQGNLAANMADIRRGMHDMKFNPMKVYEEQRYNNMSLLDKLAVTPVEPSPYYTRF